ncbi:DUF2750 domain-containing protein [Geodermatophilus sp. TF02-6]|uniref:DUF2750 domain-containing protein n=1 Tax=Geodermatophilus sp. TF02-6 TaxID=2250575 RepID=UPI0013143137|nr:DUF2750 domain-containing protein [Geodermatophilus sp. TF02-6]
MPQERLWRQVAAQRGLWGWGDADGVVPWSDDEGREAVPLWTSPEPAEAESRAGAEPGEAPVFLDLDTLLDAVGDWLAAGVTLATLRSEDGRRLPVPLGPS